eukprot:2149434-Pyramimonas_sp.AAC.1
MHEEVDNARREATHASIRRGVIKAPCQSPTIELGLASGRFVDRKGKQICDCRSPDAGGDDQPGEASGAEEPAPKNSKGPSGG